MATTPGTGNSYQGTLYVNGVATALTGVISGTVNSAIVGNNTTINVNAGGAICFEIILSATANTSARMQGFFGFTPQ